MIELLEKLEIYRLENKISQRKLAEKLGVAYNTVNRWFTGRCTPNKIQTYHIQKLLDTHKLKDTHFRLS
jgi:transcriptional regulator with XRE-family HTH domain